MSFSNQLALSGLSSRSVGVDVFVLFYVKLISIEKKSIYSNKQIIWVYQSIDHFQINFLKSIQLQNKDVAKLKSLLFYLLEQNLYLCHIK